MLRVALREVRAHLVRFGLSVLAVALAIAFVTGTFSLRSMLADTFGSIIASTTQGDLYLRGSAPLEDDAGGGPPAGTPQPLSAARQPVPLDLAATAADVDGVEQAVPDLLGTAVLVGADGQAVVNGQAPSLGSALRENDPSGTLLAGRAPRDAGEIALETTALETSGLQLGDETQVVLGAGVPRTVTVVGEATYGNPMVGTTLILVDAATGEAAFAPEGLVPSVAVFLDPDADTDAVRAALADVVPDDIEVVTGETVRAEANEAIEQIVGFLGTFLLVFALIALFVGMFIIANTFAMTVRQRQREFALLRAVGASPLQVVANVLVQAAVVGAVGTALGIAGGIGLLALLRTVLAAMSMELGGDVVIGPADIALVVALGIVASMAAAAVPARRAATTPPVEAMREDVVVVERSLRLRAGVGVVLLVGGLGAVWVALREGTTSAGTWLGVGAGGVLLGTLALSPLLARSALTALAAPFLLLRPVGRLARGNVTRSPRRTASTAGALLIGMALVGACAVIAESAQASTRAVVETESRADLTVQSATRTVPQQVAAEIAALPEVGRADAVTSGGAVLVHDGEQRTEQVIGIPADAFGDTIEVVVRAGALEALADGEAAVARTAANEHGWAVGDVLTVRAPSGDRDITVGAVIDSQLLNAPLVIDADLFAELVPAAQSAVTAVFVDANDAVAAADLRAAVDAVADPYVVLTVQDADELTSSLADQVNQAMAILYALLGLSIVIAVLGIVNTLALSVMERTREIGLLRAVGLGRLQLAGTIVIESVLTAVYGTVLGVAVGVGLAATLPAVFADQGLTDLAIPWGLLGAFILVAALVGVLAALGPAWRATRLPVLTAIATE